MPVFSYMATDIAERRRDGTLIADTPANGRETLRERGLTILHFVPASTPRLRGFVGLYSRRRRRERVAELARYLSLLLRAGIPLAESLEVLARQCDRAMTTMLKDLRDRIQGGEAFAEALAAHPTWFDELFISAVRVGELSGSLDESLCELAEHLHADQTLRCQLANALTYPCILLAVGVGVVLFLMSYVAPQLLTVLSASGRPLPASTLLLKHGSDTLTQHWALLLVLSIVALFLVTALHRQPNVRRVWQLAQLRIPVLAPLIRKSLIARFAQQMHLLLSSGVPFVDAVRSAALQSHHLLLRDELHAMAEAVESGSDIADTMHHSRVFPPVVAHLVAVGQDSGELTAMLAELQARYETEVRLAMTQFTTILEPVLIVVLAALVGFVVFACLTPIWEATRGIL